MRNPDDAPDDLVSMGGDGAHLDESVPAAVVVAAGSSTDEAAPHT